MKTCPNCSHEVDDNSSFCMNCGFNLRSNEIICPVCKTSVPSEASFCPNCGNKLVDTVQNPEPRNNPPRFNGYLGNYCIKLGKYLYGDQLAPGTFTLFRDRFVYEPSFSGHLVGARETTFYLSDLYACGIIYCGKVPVLFYNDVNGNQIGLGGVGGMKIMFKFNFKEQQADLEELALRIELNRRVLLEWDNSFLKGFDGDVFNVSSIFDWDLLSVFGLE